MQRALLLASLLFALIGGTAAADRSFEVALLQPALDGYGMLVVERAETPQRWEPGLQVLAGYTRAPLQVPLLNPATRMTAHSNLVSDQVTLDLGLSLGLWDFLAIAATIPVAAQFYDAAVVGDQVVPAPGLTGPGPTLGTGLYRDLPRQNVGLADAGPRDPRLAVKARLWRGQYVGVGLLLALTVPLGNSASFLGDNGANFRPAALVDTVLGRFGLAANLGAIVRAQSELRDPNNPAALLLQVGHELTWALGASYRVHRLAGLSLESFGTVPLTGGATSPDIDLLGAVHLHPTEGLRLSAAVGGGLYGPGPRKDDARALLGVSWSPSPREAGLP